ncbi:MAG TPA: type II toxin-antitoxin system death-on-curing family toxin [Eubacterium sp.]|nr:type II toxin-antitoxin system death-on-curing family toxin [Eubacterium sp.]
MIKFNKEKVVLLHNILMQKLDGDASVKDSELLKEIIANVYSTYGEAELYPSIEEKAAKLGSSLISNYAFAEGNKEIGMYAMLVFLELNGVKLNLSDDDVYTMGMAVADGSSDYYSLLKWIEKHRME